MHYVNVVLDWIEAHPTIFALVIMPLIGALVSWLGKPRTPEEFARMPYVLAQLLRVWAAVFPDPVKVTKVIGELLSKRVPASDEKTTGKLPPDPPSGAGGLGVLALAIALATSMQACAMTAEAAYRKQQEACVRDAKTLEESRTCRARVRHDWGLDLEPTITVTDAGAPDAAE